MTRDLATNLKPKNWYIIDATENTLGRLSTEVAKILLGKHKSNYLPHVDNGDYVVIINAKNINVTGKKKIQKIYYNHSPNSIIIKSCIDPRISTKLILCYLLDPW